MKPPKSAKALRLAQKEKSLLIRLSLSIFKRWPLALGVWLILLGTGFYTYTQVIAREGFPSLNPPVVTISANYFVNDVQQIDTQIAQPLNQIIGSLQSVADVQTNSTPDGIYSIVWFKAGTQDEMNQALIEQTLQNQASRLPADFKPKITVPDLGKYLVEYDLLITVFDKSQQSSLEQMQAVAETMADDLAQDHNLIKVEVVPVLIPNNQTQQLQTISFNRLGLPAENNTFNFYEAIHVGVVRDKDQVDTIALSKLISEKLDNLDLSHLPGKFETLIVEDFATEIEQNIDSLQHNLLTGLIIISILSFLLISWRASVVIACFMTSVLATTILIIYGLGFSLNVITLFALVLALGLLVDDAVIMVEALDLYKQRRFQGIEVIKRALKRILLASLAGTLTTTLVFVPLIFVSDILGELIRYIPLTLITVLLVSFTFSITLIPVLAKFSILKEKEQTWIRKYNPFLKLEKSLAEGIAQLFLYLKTQPKAGKQIMAVILLTTSIFIMFSFSLGSSLSFDIFSPPKDTNTIIYDVNFPKDYDLTQAQALAAQIDQIIIQEIGDDIEQINYTSASQPDNRHLRVNIDLKPLGTRQVLSSVLTQRLQDTLDDQIRFKTDGEVFVIQAGGGPPSIYYPFNLPIVADDHQGAQTLAADIQAYLQSDELPPLHTPAGKPIKIAKTKLTPAGSQIARLNDQKVINITARFNFNTVNQQTLNRVEQAIKDKFNADYLMVAGLPANILDVEDIENSFEESFQSLGYIFPLALVLIYLLLAWQFKSWLQPLLVFIALPLAMTGVLTWLYATNTAFNFFIGIGFIALMGIAINNTILLITYANNARREELSATEAISQAIRERFRPLILTTMTTIVALLPLALNNYFWQDLALTIIWGLVASTILVLIVFPYYYLGATKLAEKFKRRPKPQNPHE